MEATAPKRPADGTTRVPPVDALISFHVIAARAGVTYATVVNWAKRPSSPLTFWKVGGKRFTTQTAFTAFVESGRGDPTGVADGRPQPDGDRIGA